VCYTKKRKDLTAGAGFSRPRNYLRWVQGRENPAPTEFMNGEKFVMSNICVNIMNNQQQQQLAIKNESGLLLLYA